MDNAEKIKKKKYDPNIVGLEPSSEESSSESDDEPEVVNGHETKEIDTLVTKNMVEITEVDSKIDLPQAQTSKNDIIIVEDENKTNNKKKNKDFDKKEIKVEKKPLLEHSTVHVEVKRDPKIQVARLKLPILGEEQRIMELINENEFLIVAGETGKHNL